jgi:hypothetical protein
MKANCTVDPQKPNLTQQFLRTTRIPDKQNQTQGQKLNFN